MTDPPPCAYCSHPAVHHATEKCWTDVPGIGGGWRYCSCTHWRTVAELFAESGQLAD